jgi:hypothetical protein
VVSADHRGHPEKPVGNGRYGQGGRSKHENCLEIRAILYQQRTEGVGGVVSSSEFSWETASRCGHTPMKRGPDSLDLIESRRIQCQIESIRIQTGRKVTTANQTHPLITPIGRMRATLRDRSAWWTTSTTSSTFL